MEFGGVCMSTYLNVYVQPALVHPALSYIVCFNKKKKLWTQTFMFERQKTRREEFIFNVSKNDWCFPKKFMSHDRVMFSFCVCAWEKHLVRVRHRCYLWTIRMGRRQRSCFLVYLKIQWEISLEKGLNVQRFSTDFVALLSVETSLLWSHVLAAYTRYTFFLAINRTIQGLVWTRNVLIYHITWFWCTFTHSSDSSIQQFIAIKDRFPPKQHIILWVKTCTLFCSPLVNILGHCCWNCLIEEHVGENKSQFVFTICSIIWFLWGLIWLCYLIGLGGAEL